ncbi:hypothetical protein [Bartonella heixiaziensis]|uniref:hypothetical protein n=1 Tax=Bartonella heixiaziensis TaxID=1461000 RepID=UPI003D198040
MPLMNRFNAKAVATLGAGKYNDGAGLHFHKRKDSTTHPPSPPFLINKNIITSIYLT